ncbi:MAG: hemerythrin domain-containing protein [Anaeromyxobacteraceae bacterium]
MEAIETLMNEHRVIEGVLDALVAFVDDAGRRAATDKAGLARFCTFLREFADGQHHAKEEDVLFAEMVRHGFPERAGPVAVMRDEHERGRALVRRLSAAAELPGAWDDGDREAIAEAAHAFAHLLRAHIQKEDGVLYPLAEQHLPAAALAGVDAACAAADAARGDGPARLLALADELCALAAPSAARPTA